MLRSLEFDTALREEEKKLSLLLSSLCGVDESGSRSDDPTRLASWQREVHSSQAMTTSMGTQVTEDDLTILQDDDIAGFVSKGTISNWETILSQQIRTDGHHHVTQVRQELDNKQKKIKQLRASVIKLMQWKNSTLNHFSLLTETFLMKLQSKVDSDDGVSLALIEEIANLFAILEADLTEPIPLPKSIAAMQHLRFSSDFEEDGDEDEEEWNVDDAAAAAAAASASASAAAAPSPVVLSAPALTISPIAKNMMFESNEESDVIESFVPFTHPKTPPPPPPPKVPSNTNANSGSTIDNNTNSVSLGGSSMFKLFANVDRDSSDPPTFPPPPVPSSPMNRPSSAAPTCEDSINNSSKSPNTVANKPRRASIHLLSGPITPPAPVSPTRSVGRRLSLQVLKSSLEAAALAEAQMQNGNGDSSYRIEEHMCVECRKYRQLPASLKPQMQHTVHTLLSEDEDAAARLFDLLCRVQCSANTEFQIPLPDKRSPDAVSIEKRIFLIFLLAFELFDSSSLSLELSTHIYESALREASTNSLALQTRLHFNSFVDALALVADQTHSTYGSKASRLHALISGITSRIHEFVKNPEIVFKFFSTFWEFADDKLFSLLHYYCESLLTLFKRSKNYGLDKKKATLSESQLVGTGFSSFEIFLINHDIVPDKIPSSAVRRIVQFVRPMFRQEGLSYLLAALVFSAIYVARYQKIRYKRSSAPDAATIIRSRDKSSVKSVTTEVEEDAWRIIEDMLVRIHRQRPSKPTLASPTRK